MGKFSPKDVIVTKHSDGSKTVSNIYSYETWANITFFDNMGKVAVFVAAVIFAAPLASLLLLFIYLLNCDRFKSPHLLNIIGAVISIYLLVDFHFQWIISTLTKIFVSTDFLHKMISLNITLAASHLLCLLFGNNIAEIFNSKRVSIIIAIATFFCGVFIFIKKQVSFSYLDSTFHISKTDASLSNNVISDGNSQITNANNSNSSFISSDANSSLTDNSYQADTSKTISQVSQVEEINGTFVEDSTTNRITENVTNANNGDGSQYINQSEIISNIEAQDDKIYSKSEVEASFPGGESAWSNYLGRNLNANVPSENKAPAGNYTVIVGFIVEKDGSISNVAAKTSHGYGMEDEVIRIVSKSPKWTPGKQNGNPVKCFRTIPVTFTLGGD